MIEHVMGKSSWSPYFLIHSFIGDMPLSAGHVSGSALGARHRALMELTVGKTDSKQIN